MGKSIKVLLACGVLCFFLGREAKALAITSTFTQTGTSTNSFTPTPTGPPTFTGTATFTPTPTPTPLPPCTYNQGTGTPCIFPANSSTDNCVTSSSSPSTQAINQFYAFGASGVSVIYCGGDSQSSNGAAAFGEANTITLQSLPPANATPVAAFLEVVEHTANNDPSLAPSTSPVTVGGIPTGTGLATGYANLWNLWIDPRYGLSTANNPSHTAWNVRYSVPLSALVPGLTTYPIAYPIAGADIVFAASMVVVYTVPAPDVCSAIALADGLFYWNTQFGIHGSLFGDGVTPFAPTLDLGCLFPTSATPANQFSVFGGASVPPCGSPATFLDQFFSQPNPPPLPLGTDVSQSFPANEWNTPVTNVCGLPYAFDATYSNVAMSGTGKITWALGQAVQAGNFPQYWVNMLAANCNVHCLTPTPTATSTDSVTPTPTLTRTSTPTATITNTSTITFTPTITLTPTVTDTPTDSMTPTPSPTATPTAPPTSTFTITNTPTPPFGIIFTNCSSGNPSPGYSQTQKWVAYGAGLDYVVAGGACGSPVTITLPPGAVPVTAFAYVEYDIAGSVGAPNFSPLNFNGHTTASGVLAGAPVTWTAFQNIYYGMRYGLNPSWIQPGGGSGSQNAYPISESESGTCVGQSLLVLYLDPSQTSENYVSLADGNNAWFVELNNTILPGNGVAPPDADLNWSCLNLSCPSSSLKFSAVGGRNNCTLGTVNGDQDQIEVYGQGGVTCGQGTQNGQGGGCGGPANSLWNGPQGVMNCGGANTPGDLDRTYNLGNFQNGATSLEWGFQMQQQTDAAAFWQQALVSQYRCNPAGQCSLTQAFNQNFVQAGWVLGTVPPAEGNWGESSSGISMVSPCNGQNNFLLNNRVQSGPGTLQVSMCTNINGGILGGLVFGYDPITGNGDGLQFFNNGSLNPATLYWVTYTGGVTTASTGVPLANGAFSGCPFWVEVDINASCQYSVKIASSQGGLSSAPVVGIFAAAGCTNCTMGLSANNCQNSVFQSFQFTGSCATPAPTPVGLIATANGTMGVSLVTLNLGDGSALSVPVGTVQAGTLLTMDSFTASTAPSLGAFQVLAGNIYSFTAESPNGPITNFGSNSVTIDISYNPSLIPAGSTAAQLQAAYFNGTQWITVPSTVDTANNRLIVVANHFSVWGAFLFQSTPTASPTNTATSTATLTPSSTPTLTPTDSMTATPSLTATASPSPTNTATSTATLTPSSTPTLTPTNTATETASNSATNTGTATPTNTFTNTSTPTATNTTTNSPTFTPTNTRTATPSSSPTPTRTATPTDSTTPTPSATLTRTVTPTNTLTAKPSSTPTGTGTATMTSTATPIATNGATNTPTDSMTPTASLTATPSFQFSGDCEDGPCHLRCEVEKGDDDDHRFVEGHRDGDEKGTIELRWQGARHGIFKHPEGYLVYRAPSTGGPYVLVQTLDLGRDDGDGQRTTDFPGPGTWCYTVRAFQGNALSEAAEPCCETLADRVRDRSVRDPMNGISDPSFSEVGGSPEPARDLIQTAVAAPNRSMNGEPVRFLVHLNQPALIRLSLFTLTGERVYGALSQGGQGLNSLVWNLQNHQGQAAASGLYLYVLQVGGGSAPETRTGKILLLR